MLPLQVRVEQGVMVMNGYSILLKSPELDHHHQIQYTIITKIEGCPRGVMVKATHCGIVVREFVLQSRYYVHFRANTLGKGMNPLFSLQLWVNSRTD